MPTVWRTRHNPANSGNCHIRGCVVKRSVDIEQLLGMLHKQSSHSLVPAWFYWLGARCELALLRGCCSPSWRWSRPSARTGRYCPLSPLSRQEGRKRVSRHVGELASSVSPHAYDSVPHSGRWTVAVIGFGVRVVFGHRMRRGAEVGLVKMSVPEQQYRAVSGEGKKVCCGRCGAVLGCPGRRHTPCLPVIRQPFRFVAALTHRSQQVNSMEV